MIEGAVADSIKSRFGKVVENPIISAFSVFDRRYWPDDKKLLEDYGVSEVELLFAHFESFFDDTSKDDLLEHWSAVKILTVDNAGLNSLPFRQLWPRILTQFSEQFLEVNKLVAIMLLIPTDTSECERISSIMNDIKSAERGCLKGETLKHLMLWYSHGKDIPTAELPVVDILQEWLAICTEELTHVRTHRAAPS
eukprot:1896776-Prymnesium_polylepis.2